MYVSNCSQKLLDRIAWNFQGWFVIIQGPIDHILGAIRSKVKVTKVSKTTGQNCMKFSGMICYHPRTQSIIFWERSDQRSRSQKGQGLVFVITCSVFCPIHVKSTPKCFIFNGLSSDRSRSWKFQKHILVITRSVFVWFIWNQGPKCSRISSLFSGRSKVKGQDHKKVEGFIFVITCSVFVRFMWNQRQNVRIFNSLSSDRSKVKVTKRSKIYFGHNTLSFHPIHMKPMPKGSFFNFLSSVRSKVKVKVTKRSKTYFGHNTLSFCRFMWNQHQNFHFSIPYPLYVKGQGHKKVKNIFWS